VASSTERGAAGLTTERLDPLSMTMLPIPDESMDVSVCDPEVRTLVIRTGEAVGVYPLGCSSSAFHLTPGTYRHRPHTRWEGAGEATDGAIAWSAWLEETLDESMRCPSSCARGGMLWQVKKPKVHQAEHEDEQEQEQIMGH
jgi:hypothetical protein